jgi:hypothetical protein
MRVGDVVDCVTLSPSPIIDDMTSPADHLIARFLQGVMGALQGTAPNYQADEALHAYLETLNPYTHDTDFQWRGDLSLPTLYQTLIASSILCGYYRAWLRRHGVEVE